jgi:hypothetical protein
MRQISPGRVGCLVVLYVSLCGCGAGSGDDGLNDSDSLVETSTESTETIDSVVDSASHDTVLDSADNIVETETHDTTSVDTGTELIDATDSHITDTHSDNSTDTAGDSETDSQSGVDEDTDSGTSAEETDSDDESDSSVSCMPAELPDDAAPLAGGAFQTKLDPAEVSGYYPDVAVSGCRIHVVWTSDQQLNYRRGDHLGAPLSTRVALARDESITFRLAAQVKVDNELVVVAWQQTGIRMRISRNGGDTFGDELLLENIRTDFTVTVDDNGHLVLMYIEPSEGVKCSESTDFGVTWTDPIVALPHETDENWSSVSAVTDGESIHAALLLGSMMSTSLQINYVSSESGCTGWQDAVPLSEAMANDLLSAAAGSVEPVITIDGQYLDVIWSEKLPDVLSGTRLYHRRSVDLGQTWNGTSTLETAAEMATTILNSKDVAAAGNHVRIASNRGFLESSDGGLTWTDVDSSVCGVAVATAPGGTVVTTIEPIAQLYLLSRP